MHAHADHSESWQSAKCSWSSSQGCSSGPLYLFPILSLTTLMLVFVSIQCFGTSVDIEKCASCQCIECMRLAAGGSPNAAGRLSIPAAGASPSVCFPLLHRHQCSTPTCRSLGEGARQRLLEARAPARVQRWLEVRLPGRRAVSASGHATARLLAPLLRWCTFQTLKIIEPRV